MVFGRGILEDARRTLFKNHTHAVSKRSKRPSPFQNGLQIMSVCKRTETLGTYTRSGNYAGASNQCS